MPDSSAVAIVLQFAFATLLPVITSVVLVLLEKHTRLGQMSFWPKQVLYGLIFGLIAIYGTEAGIKTNDATMNVRDAAPLIAGLYFGGPAGIIAGIIGGVERWFAALWGRGMFTRVACSVATAAVGFYAAALRRWLFDDRRPTWPIALAIGGVAEVLHLLLVFLTNFDDAQRAFVVVQACTLPMILCNALSTALAAIAIGRVSGQITHEKSKVPDISQRVQGGMLGVVLVGFAATVAFVYVLQSNLSTTETNSTLNLELKDVEQDIRDASDANLLTLADAVAMTVPSTKEAESVDLAELAKAFDLAEIHVIDSNGIIVASSGPEYIGFDMSSGEQAAEFLALLPGGNKRRMAQDYQSISMDERIKRKYAGVTIKDGFVQVGYDATLFVNDLSNEVRSSVANRHVGHEGLIAVLTGRDSLVGTRSDIVLAYRDVVNLSAAMERFDEGSVFEVTLQDRTYLAMYRSVEGLRVMALLPTSEAETSRDLSVLVTSFMEVLVFAALFAAIYVLIKAVVVRSIWQVNGRLGQITKGDLDVEVDVRDSSEFASLSSDINETVAALRDAIAAESRRIERDLATAKAIQESALPRTFPPFPDIDAFDIYASMNAAREVGGDFYDFFLVDDHTLCFLIADVSGKGIPASLFMMAAKSELSNYIKSGMELSEAVQSANWNLCQGNDAGMFVTVWAATLDYETGKLTYVNAGHNPPMMRHDGEWIWLKKKCGLFLGTFETAKYRQEVLWLERGDEILLYTDGVNEAFNVDEEEYGNDRLEAFLKKHNDLGPHMLVDSLRSDVRKWARGAEQSDDVTMVCVEYGAAPEVSGLMTVSATDAGLDELRRQVHYELSQLSCPEEVQRKIDLTIEELFVNVCEHGYEEINDDNEVQLAYIFDADDHAITITITDWGVPFDPTKYRRPNASSADDTKGMGILIAIGQVDDIAYVRDEDRNVIAFRKAW